ncbi:MAG: MBL fold metallo-hydrolase [Chloroflexi bacterium]|nr:MBL fold metallo-hydrolase [Chloroflexota bacterium]
MQVLPLAADSLGVRSMATLVQAGGQRVLIDPGVALAESRYGLAPSQEELKAREAAATTIVGALCQADAVVVTHYHDDHANLLRYVLCSTRVYLKTPVTPGERRYAQEALPRLQHGHPTIALADGSSAGLGKLSFDFSPPLPHGKPGAGAGSVMAVAVRSPEGCYVHAGDVQGPLSPSAMEWILRQRPDLLYLSGAPTYRLYYQAAAEGDTLTVQDVRQAKTNLLTIMKYTGCEVILDHYLTRDLNFRRLYQEVFATRRVRTAAAFLGQPERLLEARRRDGESREVATLVPRNPGRTYAAAHEADPFPPGIGRRERQGTAGRPISMAAATPVAPTAGARDLFVSNVSEAVELEGAS